MMEGNVNHCGVSREEHAQLVLSRINSLWKGNELTDVTLLTSDGAMIQAHKLVLAASSDYFRKIFQQVPPSSNPIIICGGKHFEQMESVVKFIYQGESTLREDHLQGFREACQEFQIIPSNIKYHPLPRMQKPEGKKAVNVMKSARDANSSNNVPPPLKKRKINHTKQEYSIPSQLKQLLQDLPGLASAASVKEFSPARESPLNLTRLMGSKQEGMKENLRLENSSTKVSDAGAVSKEFEPESPGDVEVMTANDEILEGEMDEDTQSVGSIQKRVQEKQKAEGSMQRPMQKGDEGEESKNSDAGNDAEKIQAGGNEFMPVLEDESEKQTDAENLKKALDSFTSKLSTDAVETVEVSITKPNIKHEVIDVAEKEQSVASAPTMPILEVAENSSNDARMDTDAEVHRCEGSNPNESTEEDDTSDSESETHGDADSNVGQNMPKSSPMRTSQNFASMQNPSKSKPKPMQSKQSMSNSYPNLQHQPFPNFASGYGFDPERLLFGNYPQNPFLNPNFAAMLDPKQLLANLSSSLTANQKSASQLQPQRPRKATLVRKPLKLAPKKPLKRDYSQWQQRMVTQSSANQSASSSSSSQSQQYNLLRSILTQPTPKQSKPCTVTSSSCSSSNDYSIQDFASNQHCNRVSWSDAGASMAQSHNNAQHSIQKPRPKASIAKVKRSTQYTCSVCSRQFIYFKAYQEHLNSHISAIHCPGCTKTFASRGFLERHLDSGKCCLKKK